MDSAAEITEWPQQKDGDQEWTPPCVGSSAPRVNVFADTRSCKGEDLVITEKSAPSGFFWHFFAVLDGHQGVDCAEYVKGRLWPILTERLPETLPSSWEGEDAAKFGEAIRVAILKAFDEVDEGWYDEKKLSGTTATVALLADRFLTVANVGDSSGMLYTESQKIEMTKSHRLATSKMEQKRLKSENVSVAPLNVNMNGPAKRGEEGFGPLRVWPGGLAVSRSIGDADVTPQVVCFPHIKQIVVPESGARLVLASDGVWDSLPCSKIHQMFCIKRLHKLPQYIINSVARVNGGVVLDDTTLLAVDILPESCRDFKELILKRSKRRYLSCCIMPVLNEDGEGPPQLFAENDSLYMGSMPVRGGTITVRNPPPPPDYLQLPESMDYTVHGASTAEIFDTSVHSSGDLNVASADLEIRRLVK
ncbi:hypothetical protein BSKO_11551 [Bryopsis sp. KO-2023]|nr:hypothetical protein BSKO_11551 [Bryopsis sp. KO-2023]